MASSAPNRTRPKRIPPQPEVRERRQSRRIPSVTAGKVGTRVVRVFDVSLEGVGFRADERFEVGVVHPIIIGNGPMYLEGTVRVASVRVLGDGGFDVGGVFV